MNDKIKNMATVVDKPASKGEYTTADSLKVGSRSLLAGIVTIGRDHQPRRLVSEEDPNVVWESI